LRNVSSHAVHEGAACTRSPTWKMCEARTRSEAEATQRRVGVLVVRLVLVLLTTMPRGEQ